MPGPTPSGTTSAAEITGVSGMPEGGTVRIDGVVVEQSVNNDPAFQISISRPVVPGQPGLNDAVRVYAEGKEAAFRADYQPSPEVGPELNVTWELAAAAGPYAVVRMQTREFGGASGQVTHQVFYGDGTSGNAIAAAGLIDPIHRDALAALISTGVAKVGIALDAQPPRGDAAMALLTDLAVTPSGDLVAHLDQGVLAPYSAGNLTITVERDKSAPLLSAFGRSVAAAVTGVVPYAAPADSGSSSGSCLLYTSPSPRD